MLNKKSELLDLAKTISRVKQNHNEKHCEDLNSCDWSTKNAIDALTAYPQLCKLLIKFLNIEKNCVSFTQVNRSFVLKKKSDVKSKSLEETRDAAFSDYDIMRRLTVGDITHLVITPVKFQYL